MVSMQFKTCMPIGQLANTVLKKGNKTISIDYFEKLC